MNAIILDPSDSATQRSIEGKIVGKIALREGCVFQKATSLNGIKYEFDFYNEQRKIIGEVYAGIDNLSPGAKRKVITDCFKLVTAEKKLGVKCDKRIVFIDEKIKKHFEGKSWIANAIKQFEIKLFLEKIEEADLIALRTARAGQQNGNIKKRNLKTKI